MTIWSQLIDKNYKYKIKACVMLDKKCLGYFLKEIEEKDTIT